MCPLCPHGCYSSDIIGCQNSCFLIYTVLCDHPLSLLANNRVRVTAMDYNFPIGLEGTNVSLSCNDSKLVLDGPNTTTCMENGEWEPDPKDVRCKGIILFVHGEN